MSVSEIPTNKRRYLLEWLTGLFGGKKKQADASAPPAELHPIAFMLRYSSGILILLGAILLAYVGFEYTQMYWSQKRLENEWAREQQRQAQHVRENGGATAKPIALKDDGLTRLSIPSISFDAVVVEGTSNRDLLLGPGHLQDTPAPGAPGNSVISGHRDTFFRHIHELAKGDQIVVQRNGKTFHYEVTGKHIVQPTDLSVLQPSKDAQLTLITCYPTYYIGPAPERLVVTSKLVADSAQTSLSSPPASDRAAQSAVAH